MSTITAILEPDPDGTLHLPLPPELRNKKLKVTATVEAADGPRTVPRATPEMVEERLKAMEELRAMGGLKDVIPDPVAWQREIREDRPHPWDK